LFAALFFVRTAGNGKGMKAYLLLTGAYFGVLSLLCAGYLGFLTFGLSPSLAGNTLWRFVRELLVAVYFLVGFSLIVGSILDLLRTGVRWLNGRLGRGPDGEMSRVRAGLCQALPPVLLVPVILPYCLASFYVHRVKVPNPAVPERLADRPFEDISFQTVDGLTIRGWFVPARQPSARTLLVCHGLGANRAMFLPCVDIGDAIGANVLLFDFRGHGDSDGHTISFGKREKLDVLAAAAYLRTQRPEQARQLIAHGTSMGASALIQAAAEVEPPFDAVIVDSGFCSPIELTDMVLARFPTWTRPALTGVGVPLASLETGCWLPDVNNAERIGHVRAPLLIIHALHDGMISCEHSRRLYAHAVEPKTLWIPDSGDHGSALAGAHDEYLRRVRELVKPPICYSRASSS
jgi:alpha-beta hydrolase superfamily lysophospholipase